MENLAEWKKTDNTEEQYFKDTGESMPLSLFKNCKCTDTRYNEFYLVSQRNFGYLEEKMKDVTDMYLVMSRMVIKITPLKLKDIIEYYNNFGTADRFAMAISRLKHCIQMR